MEKWSNFDFKKIFGMDFDELKELIDNKEDYVKEFKVEKRTKGKFRNIIAPTGKLNYTLKKVNWTVLNAYKAHGAAHGFVKKKGVKTNAVHHVGANAVGSIDLKDFFDTVGEKHLKNALFGNERICKMCKNFNNKCNGACSPSLYKNKEEEYPHKCEEVLAMYVPNYTEETGYVPLLKTFMDLVIYKGHTPQGFPTSPSLANIAVRGMDKMIAEQMKKDSIVYTRYADDLSFSTRDHDKIWLKDKVLGAVTSITKAFGFKVNKKKTKFTGRGGRMMACGVVVNDKLGLPKWKVKEFRAKVHHAVNDPDVSKHTIKKLKGFASWLMSLDERKGKKYMEQLNKVG